MELRRTDHDKAMVLLVFRSTELHRLLTERHPLPRSSMSCTPTSTATGSSWAGSTTRGSGSSTPRWKPPGRARPRLPPVRGWSVRPSERTWSGLRPHRGLGPALRQRSPLPLRAGVRGWRRRAQPSALRRLRHQHRFRGCPQPRLEAGRRSSGWAGEGLLDSTTPNGAACSSRPRQTSSRPSSSGTASLYGPSILEPTGRRSSGPGPPGKSATTAWPPSSPTTRDRQWSWARPAAYQAPEGRTASRPVPVITCRPVLSVPRPQRQPDRLIRGRLTCPTSSAGTSRSSRSTRRRPGWRVSGRLPR